MDIGVPPEKINEELIETKLRPAGTGDLQAGGDHIYIYIHIYIYVVLGRMANIFDVCQTNVYFMTENVKWIVIRRMGKWASTKTSTNQRAVRAFAYSVFGKQRPT